MALRPPTAGAARMLHGMRVLRLPATTFLIFVLAGCASPGPGSDVLMGPEDETCQPAYDRSLETFRREVFPAHTRPESLKVLACAYEMVDQYENEVREACAFTIDPAQVRSLTRFKDYERGDLLGPYRHPLIEQLAAPFPKPLVWRYYGATPATSFYLDAEGAHGVVLRYNQRCGFLME